MTKRERLRESSAMMSSEMPSEKSLLLRMAAQVVECEHSNRWFVGQWQCFPSAK